MMASNIFAHSVAHSCIFPRIPTKVESSGTSPGTFCVVCSVLLTHLDLLNTSTDGGICLWGICLCGNCDNIIIGRFCHTVSVG